MWTISMELVTMRDLSGRSRASVTRQQNISDFFLTVNLWRMLCYSSAPFTNETRWERDENSCASFNIQRRLLWKGSSVRVKTNWEFHKRILFEKFHPSLLNCLLFVNRVKNSKPWIILMFFLIMEWSVSIMPGNQRVHNSWIIREFSIESNLINWPLMRFLATRSNFKVKGRECLAHVKK